MLALGVLLLVTLGLLLGGMLPPIILDPLQVAM